MSQDEEHLRLLSIFHYVVGAMAGVFALFPIFHLIFGLLFLFAPDEFDGESGPPPPIVGWFFVLLPCAFIIIGWVLAAFILIAGRCLAGRKHYLFCFVMACVECLFIPFGTVLGVFTILVLARESVKQLFDADDLSRP